MGYSTHTPYKKIPPRIKYLCPSNQKVRKMELRHFQERIRETYFEKDSHRGIEGTFLWFAEEIGELARAIRKGDRKEKEEEFADVFAWLVSLANLNDIRLDKISQKYMQGCPKCEAKKCICEEQNPGFLWRR